MDGELEVAEAVTEIAEVQPVTAVAEVPHAVAEEVPHAVAAVAVPHDAAPAPHAVAIATTAAGGTITSAVTDAAAAVRMASALTANAPTLAEAAGEYEETDAEKVANAKRPWTSEEDGLLVEAIQKYGTQRWPLIAGYVQRGRAGKQCRERWFNHLCPSVKKGDWTPDEDKIIQDGVAELGTKWSEIVKRLPGRTDNSIKNRYNSQLRREQRRARAAANGGGAKPAEPAPIAITAVESATATASSAADEEEPNAKRMRLETEATLAAAAAAVSAYTGSASTADAGSALPMPATDAALD